MLREWVASHAALAFLALIAEALLGYPAWLHARIPHPVVWAGSLIDAFERWWNRPQYSFARRRLLGCVATVLMICAALALGAAVEFGVFFAVPTTVLWGNIVSIVILVLVATVGLAQRSLFVHVKDVLLALRAGDLEAARERVSHIVGRDTRQLNASGVSAAALESLAESFNDGIVAPAFWLVFGGLPGLFAYKVLNTADSLIGHKEERWRAFGWAAARADDVANLIPARIAGTLLVFAGWGGLLVMFKDASKHASPNAGWPEAAMAGALGVRLGGPTSYDGVVHERPVFGSGPAPGVADLGRGLRLYAVACVLLWVLTGGTSLALAFFPVLCA
ncbi:MAG: cobalamin biosynthesis protein CobD [Proteobacteria bacterium]|nr:cobalamin biosynthesis protein CobD [Pseudomonadota bacterium]